MIDQVTSTYCNRKVFFNSKCYTFAFNQRFTAFEISTQSTPISPVHNGRNLLLMMVKLSFFYGKYRLLCTNKNSKQQEMVC